MAADNVEIVRAYLGALADGGSGGPAKFWDPDISWRAIEGAPDDVGEMVGAAAVLRYLQDWVDMFDDIVDREQALEAVGLPK
jgi:ketosteroid isomerase-like protein